jgi:hypothetical protein
MLPFKDTTRRRRYNNRHLSNRKESRLPKTNYKYEKRQKHISKQKKRAEKLKRRQEKKQMQEGLPVENPEGTAGQGQGAGDSDPAVEE